MITLKDLKVSPTKIKEIQLLDSRPKYLWAMGKYDGVLSGMCEYNGAPHYFECFKDYHIEARGKHNDRVFAIVELPVGIYLELKSRHEIFRDLVGWHSTYDENGKSYPMYPEFTDFKNKTKYEIDLMCKQYYDVESKKIERTKHANILQTLPVVACWSCYDIHPKNIENNKNREKTLLLAMLKDEIINLSNEQKENKIERRTNNSYNEICWRTSRDIRAHLIAYNLLRDKSYKSMEINFKDENEPWFAKYHYKLGKTFDLIKAYGTQEDINKWSLKALKDVLRPSNTNEAV